MAKKKSTTNKRQSTKFATFVNERRMNTINDIQTIVTELNTKSKVLSESKNQLGAGLYAASNLAKLNRLVERHAALHLITEATFADNASVAKFEAIKKAVGVLLAVNRGNEIDRWLKQELQIGVVASALHKLKSMFDNPNPAEKQYVGKGDPLASRRSPTSTATSRGMGSRTTAFFEQVEHINDPDQLLNVVAERLADAMNFFQAYEKLFGDEATVEKLRTTPAGPARGMMAKISGAFGGKSTRAAIVKAAFKNVPNFNADKFGLELSDDVLSNNVRAEAQVFSALGDIPEFFAASKSKLNKSIGQSLGGFLSGYGTQAGLFGTPPASR